MTTNHNSVSFVFSYKQKIPWELYCPRRVGLNIGAGDEEDLPEEEKREIQTSYQEEARCFEKMGGACSAEMSVCHTHPQLPASDPSDETPVNGMPLPVVIEELQTNV